MPRSLCTLLIIGAALLVSACASNGDRDRAAYEKSARRATTALLRAGDADSLAAAAMLTEDKQSPDRLTLLARASAAAPDRPDLVWLNLVTCSQTDSCDPQPMEAQLHALDPGNAAAWATALARSAKLGGLQMDQALLAMANSERYDIYWNATIAHLTRAIAKTRTMDLPNALVLVIGVGAAEAIPAYERTSRACKAPELEQPDRLAACRRLSAALRRGDTYITEMIGIAMAKRVWTEGSPEYQDALEARRVARYRMDAELRISTAFESSKTSSERYLELLESHRTEQEVYLAEITAAGLDPNPPKDWKDPLSATH